MSHDKIKAATRQRMAQTGESYVTARREVIKKYKAAQRPMSISGTSRLADAFVNSGALAHTSKIAELVNSGALAHTSKIAELVNSGALAHTSKIAGLVNSGALAHTSKIAGLVNSGALAHTSKIAGMLPDANRIASILRDANGVPLEPWRLL